MKKVIFLCTGNSCRSRIAEAFAKIHGSDIIEPYSSGSSPSGTVNPKAIVSMAEISYNLSTHSSKSLSDIPDIEYDYSTPLFSVLSYASTQNSVEPYF